MTTRDIDLAASDTCSKCGSRMIDIKIPVRDGASLKWEKVRQCIMCKHWELIDKEV
jgi:hypothetical protein